MPFIQHIDLRRPNWTEHAACRGKTDTFYPDRGQTELSREARRICEDCPVRAACLNYALENGEQHGIWGGLTARERRAYNRRPVVVPLRTTASCGTESGYSRHLRERTPTCAACRKAHSQAVMRRRPLQGAQ